MAVTAPELVVPGNPADWLSCTYAGPTIHPGDHGNDNGTFGVSVCPECFGRPAREWLTVETLPRVLQHDEVNGAHSVGDRPLRAGDTVTLRSPSPVNGCGDPVFGDPEPFATATAAEVLPIVKYGEHNAIGRYVVIEVEPGSKRAFLLDNSLDLEPMWPIQSQEIDLPDAIPGGWAIRLTDVKETT